MDSILQDLKFGFRTLGHSPGFTAVAILSLALGIGANTAIFTLTDAVFLHPLPVEEPSRVLEVYTVDHATKATTISLARTPVSYKNFLDFRDQNDVFSGLAGFVPSAVTLTGRGQAKQENVVLASANYFDVLGVKPFLGRTFTPDEDQKPGADNVAVLSYSAWTDQFGSDRGILGQTISLNTTPYTVVGVAPPNFKGTFTVGDPDQVWLPISMHGQVVPSQFEGLFNERRFRVVNVFGRLKPGVTEKQALVELRTIATRLEQQYPKDNNGRTAEVSSLNENALGFIPRDRLLLGSIALMAVVGLVLLIACVNLANLLMARSSKRAREMGIRTALGAGRERLIRQLLTESLLLSIAGGACGLAIGSAGAQLLWSFRPTFLQANNLDLKMDLRVFGFTAAVTLLTGILFGVAPALRASVPDLSGVLKSGGRGGTEAFGRSPMRSVLVVFEVALALVALIGAGLFIRSMQKVQQVDPGFESKNLFTVGFDVTSHHYALDGAIQFFRAVMDRAAATPGVQSAALATNPPLQGGLLATTLREGEFVSPEHGGTLLLVNAITPEFFDTVGIPLVSGRNFTQFDRAGSTKVAVVSQMMAQMLWPGENPIGKRFSFATDPSLREVVGVVKNSAQISIGERPQGVAYLPLEQQFNAAVVLFVRTRSAPAATMSAVLARVQPLDNDLLLANPTAIQDAIAQGLWAPRMGAALFGLFGLLGMVLASIGIYGVMAYMVAQRTNEIGIRMALGARPADVLRLVVGQGMRLAVAGIAAGVLCALALTRLMETLLFDVSTTDPVTFLGVSGVLAAVAFLAGWLPALRASRIDPVLALRD